MKAGNQMIMGLMLLAGVLVSCVKDPKDIPSGLAEDAVFGMAAAFGNEQITLAAGTNQWTMLPVVGKQDSLDVYMGVFSLNGCTDQCSPSWSFRFYQALPDASDPAADFSNTIYVGEKSLLMSDQALDSFDISLATHPGLFMSGYSYWEDLFGPTTFFHEYETVLGYEDSLNVCFQSLAYTGCQYTQCIYFDPATMVPCIVSIEPKLESARYVSLNVRPQGTPPFQYLWFNGATTPSIVIPVQDSVAEIYASVSVADALGNRADLMQTIRVQNGIVDACYFPIELSTAVVENTSPETYADQMEIIYTDEQGEVWRSTAGMQPGEAKVTIDAIHPYGLSPANQETSLVELSISAMLFNENTGEGRLFQTSALTIALSHP